VFRAVAASEFKKGYRKTWCFYRK